jgi:hypothetical protein
MNILAALLLASSFAASAQQSVAERYFSSDWAKTDPSVAPAPPTPPAAAPDPAAGAPVPYAPIRGWHEKITHMSITNVAYEYYVTRYEGGELSRYIGKSRGKIPASDTPDNVVAGSFDEDDSHKDPWNQLIPEMRHFWDCRKGPFKGLWGYDSSVNRAQKYFTGGINLKGAYDRGWGNKEQEGHGIVWHYKNGDKALAYWYLGHAAHLLEDATVPAHVLLFPHPFNTDAYETYMGSHFTEWETKIPQGEIESFDTLYDLFYHTANVTNDFDAGNGSGILRGRDGKKDRGARRKTEFPEAKLREEGDVLMPLAYRSVASIFVYFFKQIDHVPPRVAILLPADAGSSSRVTLRAAAVDDVSGVDRYGYRFQIAEKTETGWSAWRDCSAGPTTSSLEIPVEAGRRYAVRVSAVDAAGNRAFSAPKYFSAGAEPLLAKARKAAGRAPRRG